MINSFRGDYYFLSNFYEAPVNYCGITYRNNEAAFQSAKTLDRELRAQFANLDASTAKKRGRKVKLRADWEDVKYNIMFAICMAKFTQNTDLKEKLLATGDEYLAEGNTWGDHFWGVVNGQGANKLGLILMQVREVIKQL